MPATKKFGTFGGVFAPSLLTILGVIMYLRLPWIVGQAGLWITVGIIIVAHVISITTGLSVSSIATDKKVKVGGNYYIISRSMGLPLGGTLGIALFIGLSFSVSLYIIGFTESFLPTLGIEPTIANIRIYGTIAVLTVTAIVLISTSLAIKTQYFIMAAIGLSLVSIVLGSGEFVPPQPHLQPSSGSESLMVLFGIFFPAVTGFTAGVQMSGDLRDPKKSIPIGTMAAICAGFLVYTGLAIFLAYRIDPLSLISNPNILQEMAWVPALLFAGIWGATISSAMGSLLGAPRILQATSMDRITPKFFAKGYGPGNEPRNALILTFLIGEVGILIGELNLIAAIISIFFITTYGFINLSCAIENWASPDFLPSFRIPTWVSVLGAVSCFLVMIQLDLLSFIGSSILLGLLFLYLKRKELTLESGDTWDGVWSSIIRSGLHRLTHNVSHARNWRPNIILFSGDSNARPHLLDFGGWMVKKRGILSNFDLKEDPEKKVLFSKFKQLVKDEEESIDGIYSRQLECRDIYEGMETISQVYGFSGLEPNTVMLGWARNSDDPLRFAHLIRHFSQLDYNILLLDYDKARGFGQHKKVDIWWRGGSNNFTLSLIILKYLQSAPLWQEIETRICVLADDGSMANRAYKNLAQLLDDQRLEGTIKVINNGIEKRPFTEVVSTESAEADLIILGLPEVTEKTAPAYVENINIMLANQGSTLLVRASTFFEPLYIGIDEVKAEPKGAAKIGGVHGAALPPLTLPYAPSDAGNRHEILGHTLQDLYHAVTAQLGSLEHESLQKIQASNENLASELSKVIQRNFTQIEKRFADNNGPRFRKQFARMASDCYFHCGRVLETYLQENLPAQRDYLESGTEACTHGIRTLVNNTPRQMSVFFSKEELSAADEDGLLLRFFKWRTRARHRFGGKDLKIVHNFQQLANHYLNFRVMQGSYEQISQLGTESFVFHSGIKKWLYNLQDALQSSSRLLEDNQLTEADLKNSRQMLTDTLEKISGEFSGRVEETYANILHSAHSAAQALCDDVVRVNIHQHLRKLNKTGRNMPLIAEKISLAPQNWARNGQLACKLNMMELGLISFRHRAQTIAAKLQTNIRLLIENSTSKPLSSLITALSNFRDTSETAPDADYNHVYRSTGYSSPDDIIGDFRTDLQAVLADLPETVEIYSESAQQEYKSDLFESAGEIAVNLRRLIGFQIEAELLDPLLRLFETTPEEIDKAEVVADEVIRLIKFNIAAAKAPEESEGELLPEPIAEVLNTALTRISSEQSSIEEYCNTLEQETQNILDESFEKLNSHAIVSSSANLGHYIRTQESKRVRTGLKTHINRAQESLNELLVSLLYRRSEGVLWARKQLNSASSAPGGTEELITLLTQISPAPQITKALPYFYSDLFLGKQAIGKEFWIGRNTELRKAADLIQRQQAGLSGALLVVGEADSGKTALCRKIAQSNFNSQRVFRIFAPEGGSIDPDFLKKTIEKALDRKGSYKNIFASLPAKSVIIFHDLELWWERSANGLAALNQLLHLIKMYGTKCLFIVNINIHSYQFIQRLKPLDSYILGIIRCEPMSSRELQEAVLLRHRSTGMQFVLGETPEDEISNFMLARLFSRYFDYSAGNIGVTLHSWIRSISKINGKQIHIEAAKRPSLHAFENLDDESINWIQQFILHKQLTAERLQRLFYPEAQDVQERLSYLTRIGLLTEHKGVFQLNAHVQSFLTQKLSEMELI